MQDPHPSPLEHRAGRRVLVEGHASSDVGLQRRSNQDAVLLADLGSRPDFPRVLLAVADGMGGAAAGEVASRIASETIEALLVSNLEDSYLASALPDAVKRADERIRWEASVDPRLHGMGTTCTAAVLAGSEMQIAHTGDSRAYVLRGDSLYRVTADHTVVDMLVRSRAISPWQAKTHPQRHYLAAALGVGRELRVDTCTFDVCRGDVILLCSDGLHGIVTSYAIRRVLSGERDPRAACARLLQLAIDSGAPDNVSCVILRVDGSGLRSPRGAPEIEGSELVSSDREDEPTARISRSKIRLDD